MNRGHANHHLPPPAQRYLEQDMKEAEQLLRAFGPMAFDDILVRLCIASRMRLECALSALCNRKRIEPAGRATMYRVPGDPRPVVTRGMANDQYHHRWSSRPLAQARCKP